MKKVAVMLNKDCEAAALIDTYCIQVYRKDNEQWHNERNIPFSMGGAQAITQVREKIKCLIAQIEDCKVIAASEMLGLTYNIFDSYGFNVYEVHGKPEKFLDEILLSEELEDQNKSVKTSERGNYYPQKTDAPGNYFLNLKTLLATSPLISSKQALIPFVKDISFNELEVICDHVPKWFETFFKELNMSCCIEKLKINEYRVVVNSNKF